MKNAASSPSRVTLAMSPTPEDLDAQIAHRIELDEVMMDGALALERTIDLLPSKQLEGPACEEVGVVIVPEQPAQAV
ncbi:MAG TPA: hypothetical protein VK932_09205 [Kofleriaceae bacterium]|nr:hypothetical protein [Kofleriaceae bacterium]